MINVNSFLVPLKNKDNFPIQNDVGNMSLLYVNENNKKVYLEKIYQKKDNIILNCHKYIDYYIDQKKNIFNDKIKFSNISLIQDDNIYMAIRILCIFDSITIELFLLSSLPHIMYNKEFYFEYCSLIKKYNKIFSTTDNKYKDIFKSDLKNILYNIFDITFTEMLNNF